MRVAPLASPFALRNVMAHTTGPPPKRPGDQIWSLKHLPFFLNLLEWSQSAIPTSRRTLIAHGCGPGCPESWFVGRGRKVL